MTQNISLSAIIHKKYRKTRLYTGQGLRISVNCGNTEQGNTTTRDDMKKDKERPRQYSYTHKIARGKGVGGSTAEDT